LLSCRAGASLQSDQGGFVGFLTLQRTVDDWHPVCFR
jgi:hypothetical protein